MPDQHITAQSSPDFSGGYALAYEQSGFARRWLPRLQAAGLLMPIDAPIGAESLSQWAEQHWADELGLNGPAGEAVMPALRWFRNASLLAIMARDYAGQSDLAENLQAISSLACLTIDLAYRAAASELQARHGHPLNPQGQPTDLLIVGMGKLGGHELNASSDIDLIYVTDEDGVTRGRPDGGGEIESQLFFTKLGRRMAQLLGEITADGFVFRVDLRLRPNGDSGPMVCSLGMLE